MISLSTWLRRGLFSTALLSLALPVMAEERDSNADATFGAITASSGAMVRVPIDADGREDTNAAELRVHHGERGTSVNATSLPNLWEASKAMESNTAAPEGSTADSSTSWWGWNSWYNYGWRSPYYYYNYYTPSFNYYGNYYNYYGYTYPYYTYPTYYNVYAPYNYYYGYRYYYYPRYY